MKHWLSILALSATVMLAGLGSSRLWDDDEPRNAGCAREMLARGDWIVPTFNAELRAHKPALTYWCLMVSYLALGESEFSARFPSALAAIGTTFLTYAIGRRLFSARAALWAALILPTTMLFTMAGRIATPDSLLIFCVTLSMAVFVWTAWPEQDCRVGPAAQPRPPTEVDSASRWVGARRGELVPPYGFHWRQGAAIYAAMGLAVLAKGPVGLVLPTAILGMFLLVVRWNWESRVGPAAQPPRPTGTDPRSWWAGARLGELVPPCSVLVVPVAHFFRTAWSMRPLTALAVVALIAGPWYLAVGYQTDWQFLEEFFVKHNLERATGAMEGHRGGIWFYPVTLLVGFFPWSIFAVPLALDAWHVLKQRSREQAATILLLCWMGVWLGAFSLARTKLPSYATPCFPAAALLCGSFVDRLVRGQLPLGRYWPVASFGCLALIGAGATISLALVARRYLPGDEWLAGIGLIPLVGGIAGIAAWTTGRRYLAAGGLVACAALLMVAVFALGAAVVDQHQQADQLLAAARRAAAEPRLAAYKVLEPSWVYYGRRPIAEMHGPLDEPLEFLARSPDAVVITTDRQWRRLQARSPKPDLVVLASVEHFLKDERLVVVAQAPAADARASKDDQRRR